MKDKRMKDALEIIAQRAFPEDVNLWPRIVVEFDERKSLMNTLRARPALAVILAILTLLLLTGVVYAIGRLTGFIPGFGFTTGDVYVLKAPVEADENGIMLSVKNAVHDGSKFWVEVSVRGLVNEHAFSEAFILLPSGEKIQVQIGGNVDVNESEARLTYIFPALAGNPQRVTLLVENLSGQSFSLPLELRPIRRGELIPVPPTESAPLQSETQDGLTLVLENIAPDKDKTVFQVSLRFEQEGMSLNSDWNVILTGADGRIYPLTDITPETLATSGVTKVYETVPFNGSEQLTFSLAVFPDSENLPMRVGFMLDEAGFTFDPGAFPQVGQIWALDESVLVGGYTLHVTGARLVAPNELLFDFAPADNVAGVMLYSAQASGASGGEPITEGTFTSSMTFGKFPDQPFMVYVTSIYYTAHGVWQIHWQPSAAPLQAAGLSTSTPLPTPARFASPTFVTSDPLVLEVQALAQKFDTPLQQGAGWVHVIWENIAQNLQPNQTYPPPYYQDEQWYEVDADGWVLRNLTTHRDPNGVILQQAATVGRYSINFTTGDSFTDFPLYRLSLDMFTRDLASAANYNAKILRQETQCEDGSPCLLITVIDQYAGRKVWINLQTGQQVKFETFSSQGSADFTQRILLVEKVESAPQEVLDLLDKVVVP